MTLQRASPVFVLLLVAVWWNSLPCEDLTFFFLKRLLQSTSMISSAGRRVLGGKVVADDSFVVEGCEVVGVE